MDPLRHREEETGDLFEDFAHQSLAGWKIDEHGGDGDLGLARDLGMTGAAETASREYADRPFEEQGLALGPLQRTCPAPLGSRFRHRAFQTTKRLSILSIIIDKIINDSCKVYIDVTSVMRTYNPMPRKR